MQLLFLNNFKPAITYPVINLIPADQVVTQKFKSSFYWSRMSTSTVNSADGLPFPLSSARPAVSTVDTYRFNNDYTATPNLLVTLEVDTRGITTPTALRLRSQRTTLTPTLDLSILSTWASPGWAA